MWEYDYEYPSGYRTLVAPPDSDRSNGGEGDILDIEDMYRKPKHFDTVVEKDMRGELSFYPGQGAYEDPVIIELDSEEYRDHLIANAVVSRFLCETSPLILSPKYHSSRIAVTMKDIEGRLSRDVKNKARSCRTRLRRSMPKNNRYTFEVQSRGGQGTHVVTVKAEAKDRRIKNLDKADLKLSCSCPFWIYYGPEYHARRGGYLDGNSKGTATPPRIRDPKGNNLVCKHVYAVFDLVKNYSYRW